MAHAISITITMPTISVRRVASIEVAVEAVDLGIMAPRRLPSVRPPRNDEISNRYLDGLAILVQRRGSQLHDSLVRAALRPAHVEDLRLQPELVARAHGARPAELLEADSH